MKKIMVLFLLLLTLCLTACGQENKLTVGSVIFESSNEWFVEAIAGMKDAAANGSAELLMADSRYDVQAERDLIREQIRKKVDAIVICPLTLEESGGALGEATKLGIPVVTWNTVVTPPPVSQVVVDAAALGSATGEYLVDYVTKENLPPLKGAYIVDNTFSIAKERCDGFRRSVKPLVEQGKLTVRAEAKCHLYEETTVTLEKLFKEYPDINFIWCWNQMTTSAAVDYLKKTGRSDVMVAGTDMSLALAEEMEKGDVKILAITTQQPYQMGYQAVEQAIKAAKGEKVDKEVSIPTLTYTHDDPKALAEYISAHKKYVQK